MYSVSDNLVQQGLARHRAGQLKDAKRFYQQALDSDPEHPEALHLTGVIELECGNPHLAVELLRSAVRHRPRDWMFQANLGSALLRLEFHDEAQSVFQTAARLNPDEPELQISAANCLALSGDFSGAEARLRKVVRRFGHSERAWFNLGNAVRDQRRYEEAAKLYRRAAELDPNFADAHNNLGSTLHTLQQFSDAALAYKRAIGLRTDDVVLRCNLASVLIDAGRFDQAEAAARDALKIDAGYVTAHSTLGAALSSQGRLMEAIAEYRAAAALAPNDARLLTALGSALFEAGETVEGIALLQHVLTEHPDAPAAHQALAWGYLGAGRFDAGWREYSFRPGRRRFVDKHAKTPLTSELAPDLSGKAVCLLREQGLGDELFFARFAEHVVKRGASVLYRTDRRLAGMLGRNPLFTRVLADDEPVPAADFHVLLGDLPLALSQHENLASAQCAWPRPLALTTPPEHLDSVRHTLTQLGPPPYIAVTWRAGTAPDQNRSADWALFKEIPLPALAAALRGVPATILVVQRGPAAGEVQELSRLIGRVAHDLSDLNNDLEAMLALLTLIDDYVGVSNTNVHLRASAGKTARVLVPCPAEWRWMSHGDETPWFRGFRVYRQQNDGSWSDACRKLRVDLQRAHGVPSGSR